VIQKSGDCGLTLNIWQRMNKKDTKEVSFMQLLQRYPGSEKYASVGALVNIKWSDSNKGGFFCNTDLAYLPCHFYHPHIILRGGGDSLEGQVQ
jgi:hypothetical protein